MSGSDPSQYQEAASGFVLPFGGRRAFSGTVPARLHHFSASDTVASDLSEDWIVYFCLLAGS